MSHIELESLKKKIKDKDRMINLLRTKLTRLRRIIGT